MGGRYLYLIDLNKYELINNITIENNNFNYDEKYLCVFNNYILMPGLKYVLFLLKWKEENKNLEFINSYDLSEVIEESSVYKQFPNYSWNCYCQKPRLHLLNNKIFATEIGDYTLSFDLIFGNK